MDSFPSLGAAPKTTPLPWTLLAADAPTDETAPNCAGCPAAVVVVEEEEEEEEGAPEEALGAETLVGVEAGWAGDAFDDAGFEGLPCSEPKLREPVSFKRK